MANSNIGKVGWLDLTVDDASSVRDFYQAVVGWTTTEVSMGDYADYSMKPPHLDGDVAGICHKRGGNADIPTQWMPYFIVADIQDSLQAVKQLGGEAITAVKSYGDSQFVIIKDPAGAVCALYQE